MAEASEPKKETVRIKLPPRQAGGGSDSKNRETVRINLPPRAPNNFAGGSVTPKPPSAPPPMTGSPTLPGLGQPPKPPAIPVASIAESIESPVHSPSVSEERRETAIPVPAVVSKPPSPGPKKETARIATMPEARAAAPTVKMSKTQPLITAPDPLRETAPILVEPASLDGDALMESIPVPLCWALLGLSALLFIIQLWTYFS
jgi:hypothetical protein